VSRWHLIASFQCDQNHQNLAKLFLLLKKLVTLMVW